MPKPEGPDRPAALIGRPARRAQAAQPVYLNVPGTEGGIISMDHLSLWLPTQQRMTQDGVGTRRISGSARLRLGEKQRYAHLRVPNPDGCCRHFLFFFPPPFFFPFFF